MGGHEPLCRGNPFTSLAETKKKSPRPRVNLTKQQRPTTHTQNGHKASPANSNQIPLNLPRYSRGIKPQVRNNGGIHRKAVNAADQPKRNEQNQTEPDTNQQPNRQASPSPQPPRAGQSRAEQAPRPPEPQSTKRATSPPSLTPKPRPEVSP